MTVKEPADASVGSVELVQQKIARALRGWHYASGKDATLFDGFSLGSLGQIGMAEVLVRLFRQAAKGLRPCAPGFWNDRIDEKYGPNQASYILKWRRTDWKAHAFRTFVSLHRTFKGSRRSGSVLALGSTANRVLWDFWLDHRNDYPDLSLDFALQFPPGYKNAYRAILAGACMFDPKPVTLEDPHRQRLDQIRTDLLSLPKDKGWKTLFDWNGVDLSPLFAEHLLTPFARRLEEIAVQYLSFQAEFERHAPRLLLLPQDLSTEAKILCGFAKKKKIPVWFLNHGFLGNGYSFDENFFVGGLAMDHIIAWGELDRKNYVSAGYAPSTVESIGNPVFDHQLPLSPHKPFRGVQGSTVLLLGYARPYGLAGFHEDNEEKYFTEIVTLLHRLGVGRILFKLHAGRSRMEFYKRLASKIQEKPEIEFLQNESILPLIARSDFAVGPVSTAIFETILGGRDFFMVHYDSAPTAPPVELHRSYVAKNIAELERNLTGNNPLPRRQLLKDFCNISGKEGPGHFSRKILGRLAREVCA